MGNGCADAWLKYADYGYGFRARLYRFPAEVLLWLIDLWLFMWKEEITVKTWNAPEFQELDVRLTADGQMPDKYEQHEGWVDPNGGGFITSKYNTATHESNGSCVSPIDPSKTSVAS